MATHQEDVIAALCHLVQRPSEGLGQGPVWVSGRASPDGAVMLHHEHEGGRVLGYRCDLADLAALFDPGSTMTDLAEIVHVDDLCSPAGPGVRRTVD